MHNKQSFLYIHFSLLCLSGFGNKLYLQNHIQLGDLHSSNTGTNKSLQTGIHTPTSLPALATALSNLEVTKCLRKILMEFWPMNHIIISK